MSVLSEDLGAPVSRDTSHVVMHGRGDRNGLLGGINTSKDVSSLKDTWETLVDLLGRQMVQMEVDVVLLLADTTTLEDLQSHGS